PAIAELVERPFATMPDMIHAVATMRPDHPALIHNDRACSYAELDALIERVAATLQRDGFAHGDVIAICASSSIEYAVVFLGSLRAGVAVAPLAPSSTAESLRGMISNAQARLFFTDADVREAMG